MVVVYLFNLFPQDSTMAHNVQLKLRQQRIFGIYLFKILQGVYCDLLWVVDKLTFLIFLQQQMFLNQLDTVIFWKLRFSLSFSEIGKQPLYEPFTPLQQRHIHLMLVVYLNIATIIRPKMYFHLQRLMQLWVRFQTFTLFSFVCEFDLHLTCLTTVMHILTVRAIFVDCSVFPAVPTLHLNGTVLFIGNDIVGFEDCRRVLEIILKSQLQVLIEIFVASVQMVLLTAKNAFNQGFTFQGLIWLLYDAQRLKV